MDPEYADGNEAKRLNYSTLGARGRNRPIRSPTRMGAPIFFACSAIEHSACGRSHLARDQAMGTSWLCLCALSAPHSKLKTGQGWPGWKILVVRLSCPNIT